MAGFSNFLELKILDHLYGRTTYTAPATLYMALFTTNPNFATGAGGTAVSGANYSRLAIENNTTNFPNATTESNIGTKTNGVDLVFATPGAGGWGTVTGFGFYDASTDGNWLGGNALTVSKTINEGDEVKFPAGALVITLKAAGE